MCGDIRLEELLINNSRCRGIEVGAFNRSGLLEESFALDIGRDERRALIGIFGGDIARDGAALVKNETIILDIERQDQASVERCAPYVKSGDLAKGLSLQVLCRFMLTIPHVDLDELEGDFLLEKNGEYALSAGGEGNAVKCQDHGCEARECVGAEDSALQWLCEALL